MSLLKKSTTVGGFTLLSRLFGFVRDVIIANTLGASWLSDAFFVAFKLPNFFRRLFGEGALNAAFVPLFGETLEKEGKPRAMQFAGDIFALLTVILLILNAVMILAMPAMLHVFAPGFVDQPEKFELTTILARIAFPYIFFISLVSLLSGILNSFQKFAAVAAAPILLNLCLIFAALFLAPFTVTAAHALAIGVFLAGIAQLIWIARACKKHDILPQWRMPRLSPDVKKFFILIAPAALGAGVAQVNLLIDVILASTLKDAVSFLYYADRLVELPIGVIGVAVGVVLLPTLTKLFAQNDLANTRHTLNKSLELVLVLTLPAALALMLLPSIWISLLFEHGAFSVLDTAAVSPALVAYASGLPAFILVKIFAPGFFAQKDTKTPVKIAMLCVLINLTLNLLLIGPLGHVGLAFATSVASWVNAGLMGYILYKRGIFRPSLAFMQRLVRIFIVALLFGLWLLAVATFSAGFFTAPLWLQIPIALAIILTSKALYLFLAIKLYAVDKEELLSLIPAKLKREKSAESS